LTWVNDHRLHLIQIGGMLRTLLAIIGFGRLGKACVEAIAATEDLAVAGIVRRPESLNQPAGDIARCRRSAACERTWQF